MIKRKEFTEVRHKIVSVTCDVCGKTYDDVMEIQEFLFINLDGGFNSIFGDESKIECEVCQHCLKELLGKYLRVSE